MSKQAAPQRELTSIWTPANIVTCVRIVFIPVFMLFALGEGELLGLGRAAESLVAFVLYVTLSLTDKVDGNLARSRGEITNFGKFLDPIADKLLVFSALLVFLDHGLISTWIVFVILIREFLVSALRMIASAVGVVIAADQLGQAKTAVTMVAICGYLLTECLLAFGAPGADMLGTISWALMIAAVVLTVVSGIQYFWNCRDVVFRI